MPDQPDIFSVVAEFMTAVFESKRRELHVAEPVWRFLRDTYAATVRPEAAQALMGMPVVIDDDLTGGMWQIREDGQVTSSGDMAPAPEGTTVMYSPHAGWLAIRTDLAAPL